MTNKLLSGIELWNAIHDASATCKPGERRVAVAYVSQADILDLGRGDVLVVNAGRHAMAQGSTTKFALQEYLKRGVLIYNRPDLHTKVIVLGKLAVVGSSNISRRASRGTSVEAAVVTTSAQLVRQVASFIDDLHSDLKPMTSADVARLPDAPETPGSPSDDGPEVIDPPRRLWAYWNEDHDLSAAEVAVIKRAKHAFQGRAKHTVLVDADDRAEAGDLLLPVWMSRDGKVFGPPARVLGRHQEDSSVVLVAQDMDGYTALGTGDEHLRLRARLPRPIRDLSAGDLDVTLTGKDMTDALALFIQ